MKIKIMIVTVALLFIFAVVSNAQTDDSPKSTQKSEQAEKPLKIKSQPRVEYTQGDCNVSKTFVNLKVTFDKSGKITKADMVKSSGCEKFDKQAISAARKIKFNPAMKNGKPITVTKAVQCTFEIF